jgi:hypothetical protein
MLLWSVLVVMLLSSSSVWCKNSSLKLKRPSGSLKLSWDFNYIHFQAWDSGCSSSYTSTFSCQLSLKRAKKLDLKKLKNLQTPETFMQILVCTYQKGKKSPSSSWLCKCILVLWIEPRYIAKATGVAYTCCCTVKPKMAVHPAEARAMTTPNLLKKIREILTYLRCTKPIHICLAFSWTGETERVSKTHLYLLRAYICRMGTWESFKTINHTCLCSLSSGECFIIACKSVPDSSMYKNFNTHATAVPTQAMQKNISF